MTKKSNVRVVATKKSDVQDIVNNAVQGEDAFVFVGEQKVKPSESFVMLFCANFNRVLCDPNSKLNMADMRVLFCVLEKTLYGNQLSIKQKAIAIEMEIDASNVSKSWRKLSTAGIFMKDKFGNEFINFDLFLKGKGKNVLSEFSENAKLSHEKMADRNIKTIAPFPYGKPTIKFDDR
jgi:DNA-binding MarR family transcriptional regulator